jgi:ABC-type bacteriocin/lantibiotic exporter with double-glycine peptidase domain/GGDEF domain-containing protein
MEDFRILKKYHSLLKPFLGIFLISILFDVVMTLLGLVAPLFTRVLFDYAYPYRDLALLNIMIFATIGIYFIYFFISVASDYLQIYIGQETTARLTERVYHAIQCLPLRFHQEKKPGDLLIRITDDVSTTVGMVFNVLPTFIIDGGRFIIILAIALSINPKLTVLALLSVPLYVIEAKFYAKRLAAVQEESIDADSNIFSRASERIGNIKTIKAFGMERQETLSFAQLIRRRFRVSVKGRLLGVVQTFTNSLTLQMWSIFLTWYLGYQVVTGNLTIGEIVALMLYIDQLDEPIHSFIGLFTEWKTNMVSMHRLDEILDQPSEETMDETARHLAMKDGKVATNGLSFEYEPDTPILHDIDVKFPSTSFTAIVGGSGSGKSTLVNLMLRFFDPTAGIIFVDGQNISEVRVHELRERIGIVAQDAALFDGTVIDNILYGNEGKSRGDAMRMAQLAGAHDFIMRLPGAYDAQVGIGGELLSGGQKQRIVIARTLLRDPSIVIFDEATAALDAESEFRIQEVIASLRTTKTVIVIAHRLSTIKMADNIMVLEDGRFVEEGGFDELLEKKGAFYRFYWRQFGGLAVFRQQLGLELERASRYGSRFSLAFLKVHRYHEILAEDGVEAADAFMDAVDMALKRAIRMGDNCAILDADTILFLAPEIDSEQLAAFFRRIMTWLPRPADEEIPYPIEEKDLFFVGTSVTKKIFKTPEELLAALKQEADSQKADHGAFVVDAEELKKKSEEGK